jgi:hypothetical protein
MSYLLFTIDFHELLRGQLKPGDTCAIVYDPLRLVGKNSPYKHGSPDYQFMAHVNYLPGDQQATIPLLSEVGVLESAAVKITGQGSMLKGSLTIPADADEIVLWFSTTDPAGNIFYDSDFGANFHFRFIDRDIRLNQIGMTPSDNPGEALFRIELEAKEVVSAIYVRYRIVNNPNVLYTEIRADLSPISATDANGYRLWKNGETKVARGVVIAYDIIYFVRKVRFKLDNDGNYYICS